MPVNFLKERNINFLAGDFSSFKKSLIQFSQAHHSGILSDANEASPSMALIEQMSAIGDMLAFRINQSFMELQQNQQQQLDNATSFAKSLGYRPRGKSAARGSLAFVVELPATTQNGVHVPDDAYAPILRKGARAQGPNGVFFESLEDVKFNTSSFDHQRFVTGSRFDNTTGLPTYFAVRKDVDISAGETKTDTFTLTNFQQFLSLELTNSDVIEIISCTDSDGNEWTEVDYLAQDTVFDSTVNLGVDSDTVPYILKLLPVPRRFITDRDPLTGKTSLIFGSGDGINFDDELIPNLADLALPLAGRRTFTSYPLDPQNFLKTRTLGLSPYSTTVTVTYRVGGGSLTNVPPGSIRTVTEAILDFTSTGLDNLKKGQIVQSIACANTDKTDGGGEEETISEIKANSAAFFSAQNRAVTPEDFIARIMSLPAKFGKPDKVFIKRTNALINSFSLDVHILSRDTNGFLVQSSPFLAQNIRNYLKPFKMLGDGINILQTDIINLKVEFGMVVSPKFNRSEILAKGLNLIADYLKTDNMQIGKHIIISDLFSKLQNMVGVVSLYKLQFKNIFCPRNDKTNSYSTTRFSVVSNIQNNILLCPPGAIFELKSPNLDVIGESK